MSLLELASSFNDKYNHQHLIGAPKNNIVLLNYCLMLIKLTYKI